MLYRVPLLFTPQPEGGFTVTSPVLPELVTEAEPLDEAFANAEEALAAVLEPSADKGRQLPAGISLAAAGEVMPSLGPHDLPGGSQKIRPERSIFVARGFLGRYTLP